MSIINKYRPKVFKDVIGQDAALRAIKKSVEKGNSNVYLFTGGSGFGKTTLSRLTAKALGCTQVDELDAATRTGVEDMKDLIETLPYQMDGGKRAIIIDEIHAISKQAWEALLKSLEEPPEHVYWFLCTTELKKVPKTVKTRSLHIDLKPVDDKTLGDFLDPIAKKEGGEEFVDLCIKEADGSVRQALSNLAAVAGARDDKEARAMLQSLDDDPEIVELARALLGRKTWREVQAVLKKLKEANKDAEGIRRVVSGYMTAVATTAGKESLVGRAVEVLDAFSEPAYNSVGLSHTVVACATICFR